MVSSHGGKPPWELGSLLIWWKKMEEDEEDGREREWGGREREEKLGILKN
jgi:hypothetical protein